MTAMDGRRTTPETAGTAWTGRLPSATAVLDGLAEIGYLADRRTAGAVHLAAALKKPVLVEGPAGTGKTQLAKSVAQMTGSPLVRLQCYEGLDESRALYEWDYRRQLLAIQAPGVRGGDSGAESIFAEEFLLERPLLRAIRSPEPAVLLIDEVDRLDAETEALLLEVLSDYQVSIPELGTVTARHRPMVFLTSNADRELSDALKRRCLFLSLGFPAPERERDIILANAPDLPALLAERIAGVVASLRSMELKKAPSVSETLDWAHALTAIGRSEVGVDDVLDHLNVLLKHESDIDKATAELGRGR